MEVNFKIIEDDKPRGLIQGNKIQRLKWVKPKPNLG